MEVSPEQAKEMQEKLKNMSPEDLKEFAKKNCIFCQIVEGKVQSKKIYEDEQSIAIIDINPANPGHILLLPKEHYQIMPQVPDTELSHLFRVAKKMSHLLLKALKAKGTNIFIANGVPAGQKAQHFMIHIIPRMEGDNVNLSIPENEISDKEMMETKSRLIEYINKKFGLSQESGKEQKEEEKTPPKPGKPKVVEAEFREEEKKEEKPEEDKEKEEEGHKEKEDIDLDGIARLVG